MVEAQSVGEVQHTPRTDQTRENASRSRKNAMQKGKDKPTQKAMKGGMQEDKTNMNGNILQQLEEVKKLGKGAPVDS